MFISSSSGIGRIVTGQAGSASSSSESTEVLRGGAWGMDFYLVLIQLVLVRTENPGKNDFYCVKTGYEAWSGFQTIHKYAERGRRRVFRASSITVSRR